MTVDECSKLLEFVVALCPATKMVEKTPQAWFLVLGDLRFPDCLQAVRTVYRDLGNDQEWGARKIEPDDIIREVRRIRSARITNHPSVPVPPSDLTPLEYHAWLLETTRRIGDGEIIPRPPAVESTRRVVPVLTKGMDR